MDTNEKNIVPQVINPESASPSPGVPDQSGVSQPITPSYVSAPPPPSIQPTVQVAPPPPVHKSSKLLWLLLIIFAVVLAVLVFVVLNGLPSTSSQQNLTPIQTVVSPTAIPTPTLTLEQETQNINIGSPEGDFQDIKTDLKGL